MQQQEVSRAHSTRKGKERIHSVKKLHPQYVAGFVDGEGSFWVCIAKDKRNDKIFPRAEFSIELRADDKEILHRIKETIQGIKKILTLQQTMRVLGKKRRVETARVRENRSPSGVRQ